MTIEIEAKQPEPARRRGRRPYKHNPLNHEQEMALIRRYATTYDSISAIARDYGVNATYPYRVLDKNHISWRRDNGQSFEEYMRDHPLYDELINNTRNMAEELASLVAAAPGTEG